MLWQYEQKWKWKYNGNTNKMPTKLMFVIASVLFAMALSWLPPEDVNFEGLKYVLSHMCGKEKNVMRFSY
jgi:hypothetical protein